MLIPNLKNGENKGFPYLPCSSPLNKGTMNSLKIMEPSPERSAEQGAFGGSLS